VIESDFVINTTGVNNQSSPAVAALPDGRALVTWNSDDAATGAQTRGIYLNPIIGHANSEQLLGTSGQDLVMGLAGNDSIFGGSGDDQLMAGAGNDLLTGGTGDDQIDGGTGSDRAFFTGTVAATVDLRETTAQNTGHGTDTILNVEHVTSGSGNDLLTGNALGNGLTSGDGNDAVYGGAGNDTLLGGAGNDLLTGGTGNDRVDGGTGSDRASFTGTVAVTVNLGKTTAQNTGHGTDTILNVEHVTSGSGNDRLTGNALGNSLISGEGNDTLVGGAGNDSLLGGAGLDVLTGGTGRDTFIFDTALSAANSDRITDFRAVDDTIFLDDAVFSNVSAGNLEASAFAANLTGTASDALHRIIYERDTGKLFFDADGSGAGQSVHFATLNTGLTLTSADFFVF